MDNCDSPAGNCSRRGVIRAAAVLGGAIALAASRGDIAIAAPKETGLSFEGLLKDRPGFQPRTPAPLPAAEISGFLSKAQLARSYSAYSRAFGELLAAEHALTAVSREAQHAEEYAATRKRQVAAGNSVLLHEFFFRNINSSKMNPSRYVMANMTEHMGTLAEWREDFAACARVAQAWTVLVYDPYDDRWHNVPLSEADSGGWVGANPLVVLSVADEAWSLDYSNRDDYVTRFFDHVDWNVVGQRYHAVDRQ
jgi:superoxide dismutase, Fe-Mn family